MSEFSKIEWCDHTFNPWIGCTKVSPGCSNCYAEQQDKFRSWTPKGWGKGNPRRRTSETNWKKPLKWNREADRYGTSPMVFCASLADWLDEEVAIEWLADLLFLISATPNLEWLLLTKRPENFFNRIHDVLREVHVHEDVWLSEWLDGSWPSNVWIGTSVEDQRRADERVPELLRIPAKVRFLSAEPLLGPINLASPRLRMCGMVNNFCTPGVRTEGPLHWVICGGESGRGARPFALEWADDLRKQCRAADASFFMKQVGVQPYFENVNFWEEFDEPSCNWNEWLIAPPKGIDCFGAAGLRVSDAKGGVPDDWPEQLRVREILDPIPF